MRTIRSRRKEQTPVHEIIQLDDRCIVCSRSRENVSLDFLRRDYVSHHDVAIPEGATHVWVCWSCSH